MQRKCIANTHSPQVDARVASRRISDANAGQRLRQLPLSRI